MKKEKDIALQYTTESAYAIHKTCGKKTLFVWQHFYGIAEVDARGNFLEKNQNYVNTCDACGDYISDGDIKDSVRNEPVKVKRTRNTPPPPLFDKTDDKVFTVNPST